MNSVIVTDNTTEWCFVHQCSIFTS